MSEKKRKLLIISDDIRTFSGIATSTKEIIYGTLHKFDWVQMAAYDGRNNPEYGKMLDLSTSAGKELNIPNTYLKLYPIHFYGDDTTLFTILNIEKPDALIYYTDPHFWAWLFILEHQIRNRIPMIYLNVWDNLPYPMWNKPYYSSNDAILSISKQTYNINKWVLGPENCTTIFGDLDKNGNIIKSK